MTSYWKRLLISVAIVVAVLFPGVIRRDSTVVFVGPWFGTLWYACELGFLPPALTPWLSLIPDWAFGLNTVVVLAIAARWKWAVIAVVGFFLLNAWFLYAFLSADPGHAFEVLPFQSRFPAVRHSAVPQAQPPQWG